MEYYTDHSPEDNKLALYKTEVLLDKLGWGKLAPNCRLYLLVRNEGQYHYHVPIVTNLPTYPILEDDRPVWFLLSFFRQSEPEDMIKRLRDWETKIVDTGISSLESNDVKNHIFRTTDYSVFDGCLIQYPTQKTKNDDRDYIVEFPNRNIEICEGSYEDYEKMAKEWMKNYRMDYKTELNVFPDMDERIEETARLWIKKGWYKCLDETKLTNECESVLGAKK